MLENIVRMLVPSYGYPEAGQVTIQQALERTKFTPDIDILEEYEYQLIFVSDFLKKDHGYQERLGVENTYKFPAYTQKSFMYWEGNPFEHRIPMEATSDGILSRIVGMPPVAKIKGEVYSIRPRTFIDLDTDYQNTVQFQRHRIRLIVPYRKLLWLKDKNLDPLFGVQEALGSATKSIMHTPEITCIIRAWMYIGLPSFWDPLLSVYDYKAAEHYHSNKRRWCETFYNIRRPPLKAK